MKLGTIADYLPHHLLTVLTGMTGSLRLGLHKGPSLDTSIGMCMMLSLRASYMIAFTSRHTADAIVRILYNLVLSEGIY